MLQMSTMSFTQFEICTRLLCSGVVSVIEQSPLCGPLSLLSYHLKGRDRQPAKRLCVEDADKSFQDLFTNGRNYDLLWTSSKRW